MCVAVAVGSIQGKSRLTMAEGGSRNYSQIVFKGRRDINWSKNPQVVMPLPDQPNLFLIMGVIYIFGIQKSKHAFLHNSSTFLLMS